MEQEKEERSSSKGGSCVWATVFVCLLVGCGCQERERDYGSL